MPYQPRNIFQILYLPSRLGQEEVHIEKQKKKETTTTAAAAAAVVVAFN